MPTAEKRKTFNMCIPPCLTYKWNLTKQQRNKFKVCQTGIDMLWELLKKIK